MRVLLDENIPVELADELTGHDVETVIGLGWSGVTNGELLKRAAGSYDALVTMDRTIEHTSRTEPMSDQTSPKTKAQDTIARLSESATWADIRYALFVREKIEAGLADLAAGRTFSHEEVKERMRRIIRGA